MSWSGTEAEGFDALHRRFARLNDLGTLAGFGQLFPPVTPRPPNGAFPELDFIRFVSWLYAHWHEAGRVSVGVMYPATEVFNTDAVELLSEHLNIVASHRTLLHHDLGGEILRGGDTRSRCEAWFNVACGTPEPTHQDGWRLAFAALCDEARLALEAIEAALQRLSADASIEDWVKRWQLANDRQLDDGDLDSRVGALASQMGIGPLRVPEFRRRFRAGWSEQVRFCPTPEITRTLDRAIASDLLRHAQRQHPLTPDDVIEHLGLAQGIMVGDAMRMARNIFDASPCPKDELLRRLTENWQARVSHEK
jgi:hypothetical protein